MRVKRLYPQKIVIRVMIVLQPFRCMPHGLYARIIILCVKVRTVFMFSFGPRAFKPLRRRIRTNTVLTRTRPHRITFLTSVDLPCGKPLDIIFTAADDIVRMIGKHLRMHILFTRKNALQALIKRLHCSPRFFKKVQPSGHDVAACGHARRRAAPVAVKHDRSPRQPVNIRCDGRVLARTIRGQHASIECIAQNEDGFHVVPPCYSYGCCKPILAYCSAGASFSCIKRRIKSIMCCSCIRSFIGCSCLGSVCRSNSASRFSSGAVDMHG